MHTDTIVFTLVLLGRFLLPLLIPRFPLPGILACLILDAADQSIFNLVPGINLVDYQSYDKALDIYYLSIAMLTTMRNWNSYPAIKIAQFLFYLRLCGVLLFELTQNRVLLVIFPNVFEYFFIFYEAVRAYWTPYRKNLNFFLKWAVVIWVVIKIPQEYWIHIAEMDTTNFIQQSLLGSPPSQILSEFLTALIIFGAAAIFILVCWKILRWMNGPREHSLDLRAILLPENINEEHERIKLIADNWRLFDNHMVEKVLLVGFTAVIFAHILPYTNITSLQLFTGVAIFVFINTFIGLRQARAKRSVKSAVLSFILLAVVNLVLANVGQILINMTNSVLAAFARLFFNLTHIALPFNIPTFMKSLPGDQMLFFLLLLTLIVTLYDRWHPVYDARFQSPLEERQMKEAI